MLSNGEFWKLTYVLVSMILNAPCIVLNSQHWPQLQ